MFLKTCSILVKDNFNQKNPLIQLAMYLIVENLIQYIKNKDINRDKWDVCIEQSSNPLIYAMSWYLDIVCPGWDALVEDDYVMVFPLTWGRKFGISYLYQPMFTQQLGFFSAVKFPPQKINQINQIIQSIPDRFLVAIWNEIDFEHTGIIIQKRNNFQMSLADNYENIQAAYTTNTQRNISKARSYGLSIKEIGNKDSILKLKRENLKVLLKNKHYQILDQLLAFALENNYGKIFEVHNLNNEILASAFFLFTGNSLIYLLSASSQKGKDNRAMFYLVDEIIRMNAGKNILLDFEGSEIPGLARFFSGFGAFPVYYYRLTINNLPFPLGIFYNMSRIKAG